MAQQRERSRRKPAAKSRSRRTTPRKASRAPVAEPRPFGWRGAGRGVQAGQEPSPPARRAPLGVAPGPGTYDYGFPAPAPPDPYGEEGGEGASR
jgi:hypothetical protein